MDFGRFGQNGTEQPAGMNGFAEQAAQYEGKNDDELMQELLRVTGEQKRDGTFDADGMRATAEAIMPMLTPAQAEKLNRIVKLLAQN